MNEKKVYVSNSETKKELIICFYFRFRILSEIIFLNVFRRLRITLITKRVVSVVLVILEAFMSIRISSLRNSFPCNFFVIWKTALTSSSLQYQVLERKIFFFSGNFCSLISIFQSFWPVMQCTCNINIYRT